MIGASRGRGSGSSEGGELYRGLKAPSCIDVATLLARSSGAAATDVAFLIVRHACYCTTLSRGATNRSGLAQLLRLPPSLGSRLEQIDS